MIGERMEVIQKCIKNPEYREEIKGRIAVRMAGVEDVFVEIQTRVISDNYLSRSATTIITENYQ